MKLKSLGLLLLVAWAASACGEETRALEAELAPEAVSTTRQEVRSTNKVLILGSSVNGGLGSREALAVSAFAPTAQIDVVTPAQWRAMTAEQFMAYRAILIGDAACESGTAAFDAAVDTRRTWGAIVDSNVVILSTDPTQNNTGQLVENAIQFVLDSIQYRTGMYIALGCSYQEAPANTVATLLEPFGTFTVQGVPGCADFAHMFQMTPSLLSNDIFDGLLVGNGCAARSVFTSYPDHTFVHVAIATSLIGTPIPGQRTYIDYLIEPGAETPYEGAPYVLVRGAMAVSAGCGDQDHGDAQEDCDAGDGTNGQPAGPGQSPGSTCSFSCHLQWCGDGAVDVALGEECDNGINNGRSGDTSGSIGACSSFCKIPNIPPPNRPPVVVCRNVTVAATNTCGVPADINNGSSDPDGDPVSCTQNPAGPYNIGSTTVTLTCTDPMGQFGSCTSTVTVTDSVAPTVTLDGPANEALECTLGATYPELGATARDLCEGPLPVTESGSVNMGVPATYTLTYTATDAAGNEGSATRTVVVSDTLSPTVTLSGANPQAHECGVPFADPGSSATDQCAGTLPVTISGTVDDRVRGPYTLTYSADDGHGHTVSRDRTVNVRDTLAPTITVAGPLEDSAECGSPYMDRDARADDVCAGPLPVTRTVTGDTRQPGTLTISYSATDPSGNSFTSPDMRTVTVVDTQAPALSLRGAATQRLECGTLYAEQGVVASDACYGDLSSSVTRTGSVSSGTVGDYSLVYEVADGAGNSAIAVSRNVEVRDTLPPTLTVLPPFNPRVQCDHVEYQDPGATASDVCALDLTSAIQSSGQVDTGLPGRYSLSYRVADPSGNQATANAARTVSVVDDLPPTIELLGSASENMECGATYTESGAKAYDLCAGDVSSLVTRVGEVNPAVPGDYPIVYSVTDPSNNTASMQRAVSVKDTKPPTIVCPASIVVETLEGTLANVTPGVAQATDTCTQAQVIGPTETRFPVGTTTLTYTAKDVAGNTASCTTTVTVRELKVPDTTDEPPVPGPFDRALMGGGNGCSSTTGGPSSLVMMGLGVLAALLARMARRQ